MKITRKSEHLDRAYDEYRRQFGRVRRAAQEREGRYRFGGAVHPGAIGLIDFSSVDRWQKPSGGLYLSNDILNVVVASPPGRTGTLETCEVIPAPANVGFAAGDDLLCTDADGRLGGRMICPRLRISVFVAHLRLCDQNVSPATAEYLQALGSGNPAGLPMGGRTGHGDAFGEETISDYRALLDDQAKVVARPVRRYAAAWNALNRLLSEMDVADVDWTIRLNRAIEELTEHVLSEDILESARRAGDVLSFAEISSDSVSRELRRISAGKARDDTGVLRHRLAFLHRCFADTIDPPFLQRLEKEIQRCGKILGV